MASAVLLVVLGFALVSAARNPVVAAADAAQYSPSTIHVTLCYDLADARPACPNLRPASTGMNLPIAPDARDPAQLAANALSGPSSELIAAADHLLSTEREGVWLYLDRVPLKHSTLQPPWASASAQGLGISVLARAWTLTLDARYRNGLIAAALAMPISDAGWPEALPDGSHALVGGMNGLLGLWDAWRVTGDLAIRARFDRGVSWLVANLHRYDRDFTVLYALQPNADRTSAALLQYSIGQLSLIAAASGRDALAATATEWQWRRVHPGSFRLNLILQAVSREPASWVVAAGAVLVAWPGVRQRLRPRPRCLEQH